MKKSILSLSMVLFFLISATALPCTTFFLPQSVDRVVGKNMDWPQGQGLIYINKRDVTKQAVFIYAPQTPLVWTSKYMSLTFSETGREFPWEGMNETGLSVNIMEVASEPPPATDPRPAVNSLQWIQFILDTSSSVNEAIFNAQKVKVSGPMVTTIHYMVCDRNAQCATFENIAGNLVVHTGANMPYMALTNNTYDVSLGYLQNELKTVAPNLIVNSSSTASLDRFARAALLSSLYQPQENPVTYAFNILQNVHQPNFTQWSMVFGLVPRTVFFRTLQSFQIKGVSLLKFEPHCSTPVKIFDVNSALSGDITASFVDYSDGANSVLAKESGFDAPTQGVIEGYPATTKCME